ncbi:EAL domain-containing protein [Acaryochloris sp. IP29b_bin.137]|uniref:two-component system response regulator n=1 Tax=Acaryochloris sp. IP29b_bin.137 TaxID=2969217 RepID=UPI0026292C09|nr:EAL domain-containing protein [Acaryochloris sp. IP29b_bin.137]
MKDVSILVIDDEPNNYDVVDALLDKSINYQLYYAANGEAALSSLDSIKPDLILLDIMMPGMSGIETCKKIKSLRIWKNIPIIIVTALTEKQNLTLCLSAGASDYICKPINSIELNARVKSMLRIRFQYQQLEAFNARLEEIVEERTTQLAKRIYIDELTQLPSQFSIQRELAHRLNSKILPLALIIFDCDQFKRIESSFGKIISNKLRVAISERLKSYLNQSDLFSRSAEDEFCLLLNSIHSKNSLIKKIQEIQNLFEHPFNIGEFKIFMTACIGATLIKSPDLNTNTVLQQASTAMYLAKSKGIGNYEIFESQMYQSILNRVTLESAIQKALKHNEFAVYYQPIVDLNTGKVDCLEALARWPHPKRGMISPSEFIPCMEMTGLIISFGMLILRNACQQLSLLNKQGWDSLSISVNLSAKQFEYPNLLSEIDDILLQTQINPSCLSLEITESVVMEDPINAISIIQELRSRQIQISLDDFGTGYSSLAYIHRFPVNSLKIDRTFIENVELHTSECYVLDTMIELGKKLGISVIVEGIESESQLEYLCKLGCKYGQGYLFSKPIPSSEIEILLPSVNTHYVENQSISK